MLLNDYKSEMKFLFFSVQVNENIKIKHTKMKLKYRIY